MHFHLREQIKYRNAGNNQKNPTIAPRSGICLKKTDKREK